MTLWFKTIGSDIIWTIIAATLLWTLRFVFVGWKSLLTAAVIYIILPLISIMVYYLALLFQEEARRRLAITINKGNRRVVSQAID